MFSQGMRALCVGFWVISAFVAGNAWEMGDWRRFIEQIAQALIAALIWFAVPPGAEEFRPLPIRNRSLRRVIYASVVAIATIAVSPWPWGDSAGGSSAVLVLASVIVFMIARAEGELTS